MKTEDATTASSWTIYLNHRGGKTDKAVTSLYHLTPDTQYEVEAVNEAGERIVSYFATDYEFVTLNVHDLAAKGDGESDDTILSRQRHSLPERAVC